MKRSAFALTAVICCAFGAIYPPSAKACEVKRSGTSQYTICRAGSTVMMRGYDWSTGSSWNQTCHGVGTGFTTCSGTDADGDYWSCTHSAIGSQCY